MYPNPVRGGGVVTIEGAASAKSIYLYDLLGNLLLSVTPSETAKVFMPNVTGVYLLQIRLGDKNVKVFTIIVR